MTLSQASVIFCLGGPGVGKGTQCAKMATTFGYHHLSAGDLLRGEMHNPSSRHRALLDQCMKAGSIVPAAITTQLLADAMVAQLRHATSFPASRRFLIDGFPRNADNFSTWNVTLPDVCVEGVLFYDGTEAALLSRLQERAKTSGRSDDTEATIRRRFATFRRESMPVLDMFAVQRTPVWKARTRPSLPRSIARS